MALSLKDLRSSTMLQPPFAVIYGGPGVGKTTFGASAPAPVFLLTEDGLGLLDAPHFPLIRSYDQFMEAIGALYSEEHEFETCVIDSADRLEPLIWAETCRRNNWTDLEQPGFGKGYLATLPVWNDALDGLKALRSDRNMAVVLIAHHEIKRFDSPETEGYDRYQIKLHRRAADLIQEQVDLILFAGWKVSTVKGDAAKPGQKGATRGVGRGERVLYTEERPAFVAKNRYSLPPELPLDWNALSAAMQASISPADASA